MKWGQLLRKELKFSLYTGTFIFGTENKYILYFRSGSRRIGSLHIQASISNFKNILLTYFFSNKKEIVSSRIELDMHFFLKRDISLFLKVLKIPHVFEGTLIAGLTNIGCVINSLRITLY